MRNIIFPAFIEFRARGGRLIYGTVIEIGFKPSPKMAVSMRECEQPPPPPPSSSNISERTVNARLK